MSFHNLTEIIRKTFKGGSVSPSIDDVNSIPDEAVLRDIHLPKIEVPAMGTDNFPDRFPARAGEVVKPDYRMMTPRNPPGAYILRNCPLTDAAVHTDNTVTGVFEMRLDDDLIPAITTPYSDQLNCLRDDADKLNFRKEDFKDPGLVSFYEALEHTLIDTKKVVSGITWEVVGVEPDNWLHIRISAVVK